MVKHTHSPTFTATYRSFLLASLSGVMMAVSAVFPTLFFLIWMAFIPLFVALEGQPTHKRLQLGWMTGVIFFGGAAHWVWWSTAQFFAFSAFVASLLFLCFLAWHGVLFALLAALFRPQPTISLRLLFPALLWVVLEHYYPMLFPWQFGNMLQPHLTAIQFAEVTGSAGLSFLIVLVNSFFFCAYQQRRQGAAWLSSTVAALGILLVLEVYGYCRLAQIEAEPPSPTLLIAIVQGNAPAARETTAETLQRGLQTYTHLSLSAMAHNPALIIWPEVAVRTILREDDTIGDALFTLAEQVRTPLLVGALDRALHGGTLNSAFLISPAGEIFGSYDKTRVLPFAESLPWPLQFFDRWWPSACFVAGKQRACLTASRRTVRSFDLLRIAVARFLSTSSYRRSGVPRQPDDDIWLGNTSGPWSHPQAAVMRAVESRRWLACAANSG